MTKDEAIKVLEMVEAHGIANEAKEIAIEALKTEAIPIAWIEQYGEKNWFDFGTQHNAITEMLKAWQEERERWQG